MGAFSKESPAAARPLVSQNHIEAFWEDEESQENVGSVDEVDGPNENESFFSLNAVESQAVELEIVKGNQDQGEKGRIQNENVEEGVSGLEKHHPIPDPHQKAVVLQKQLPFDSLAGHRFVSPKHLHVFFNQFVSDSVPLREKRK